MLESTPFRIAAIGGLIAIVGSIVGPFTKVGDLSADGLESGHNGYIIIALVVLTVLALATGLLRGKRGPSFVGLILAALAVLVALLDWGDASTANDALGGLTAEVDVSRGWGLYVATVGAAIMTIGAILTTLIGRKGPG